MARSWRAPFGQGGYDQRGCYEALQDRETDQGQSLKVTIPPRRGARIWKHGNSTGKRLARDENLRAIRKIGRKQWKEESNYHRRSLAESAMSRYKRVVGEKLQPETLRGKRKKPLSAVSYSTE